MPRRIEVHVKPRSRTQGVEVRSDGVWIVRVNAPAVDGKANAALVDVLAEYLACPRRLVTILSGHTSRHKRVEIPDDAA